MSSDVPQAEVGMPAAADRSDRWDLTRRRYVDLVRCCSHRCPPTG